jgi:hypothetical protein
MYVTFCDKTFTNLSSPIDVFESLIWTERWLEPGHFQVILPVGQFGAAHESTFIYNSDRENYMIVEDVETDGKRVTVTGSSLETLLEWRVLTGPTYYANSTIETTIRGIINLFATGAAMADYAFVNTPLVFDAAKNLTPKADMFFKPGTTLADMIQAVYGPRGWSYRLYRAGANVVFDTVVGKDRTSEQSVNQRAIFNSSKGDISSYSYNKNSKDYRNYALLRTVWGYDAETGTANGVATRSYNAAISGEERKLIYFEGTENYNTTQMDTLCADELKKYQQTESFSVDISPSCSLAYEADYTLGDVCDIAITEIGLIASARCTSVDFVYEKNAKRIIPSFGDYKLSPRQYIKREAGK